MPAPVNNTVRDYLLTRLRLARSLLESLGRFDDPAMAPVWRRCYGLDRIDALERGEPVYVTGYHVTEALSPVDRERLDLNGTYVLHSDGRLSPYGGDDAE